MAKARLRKSTIVTGYARLWPREVFDIHKKNELLIKQLKLLQKTGVYVLYRDDLPYYVGQTNRPLFERIHDHANKTTDKYYQLWNFFSAFDVPRKHLDEVEAILIAAMPTANSAEPKIPPVALPPDVRRILAYRRRIDADDPKLATQNLVKARA
ncbi:MAG: GIY-YIG nuclease family protein [Terriglobia bacterium]